MHAAAGDQRDTGNAFGMGCCSEQGELPAQTVAAEPDRGLRQALPHRFDQRG